MSELTDELCRIQPTEIVTNDAVFMQDALVRRLQAEYYVQCYGNWAYEYTGAKERLLTHFRVSTLSGYGCDDMPCAISAAGALLSYLEDTQKNSLCHIKRIRINQRSRYMHIDANSRRNLELTRPIRSEGSKKNTLLHHLDKTGTAMGVGAIAALAAEPVAAVPAAVGTRVLIKNYQAKALLSLRVKDRTERLHALRRRQEERIRLTDDKRPLLPRGIEYLDG